VNHNDAPVQLCVSPKDYMAMPRIIKALLMRTIQMGIPLCLLVIALSACQTTPPKTEKSASPSQSDRRDWRLFQDLPFGTLAAWVRAQGAQGNVNVVLMNGLEEVRIDEEALRSLPPSAQLTEIIKRYNLSAHPTPHYTFLYTGEIPQVLALTLGETPPFPSAQEPVDARFGVNQRLYNALAALSYTAETSLVADNIVGDVRLGELALTQVPLHAAVLALLQSARIDAGAVELDMTAEYLFIGAKQAVPFTSVFADFTSNDAVVMSALENTVDVVIPHPIADPTRFPFYYTAFPFGEVLPALSKQLGIHVDCDPAMREFPVNYVVMRRIRARTALDLIARQWPVRGIRAEWRDGSVYLRKP